MTLLIGSFIVFSILTSILVIAALMLSSHLSQEESAIEEYELYPEKPDAGPQAVEEPQAPR